MYASRWTRGQSIVEVIAGLALLVPIALGLLDFSIIIIAKTANDALAKDAARAAAEQQDASSAQTAADNVKTNNFKQSDILQGVTLVVNPFNTNAGVTVTSTMTVHLLVPIPGVPDPQTIVSVDREPVVSQLAQ